MILRAMSAVALATGRATLTGQVEGDGSDERKYPGPPGWGLGVRLTTSPRKKKYCCETSRGGQGPPTVVDQSKEAKAKLKGL
jgi:hypothetical protein